MGLLADLYRDVRIEETKGAPPVARIGVLGRQGEVYPGARRFGNGTGVVLDVDISRRIDRSQNAVARALGLDQEGRPEAERIGNTQDGFEGIALGPARRRAIGRLVGHKVREIEDAAHGPPRDAGAIVANREIDLISARVDAPPDVQDRRHPRAETFARLR